MDWNNANMAEVSSGSPPSRAHPAGPSHLAQKVHATKVAIQEVDKAAMVCNQLISFLPFTFVRVDVST
jgi:hypothetical protein